MSPNLIFIITGMIFLAIGTFFAIIKARYQFVGMDRKRIKLKRPRELKEIPWTKIDIIYNPTSQKNTSRFLTVCTTDRVEYDFTIAGKDFEKILSQIYDRLLSSFSERGLNLENTTFQHTHRWKTRKTKILITMSISLLLLLVVFLVKIYQKGVSVSEPTLLIVSSLFLVGIIYLFLEKRKIIIESFNIYNKNIHFKTASGLDLNYNLSQIKSSSIKNYKGILKFEDGTTLSDLEKMYYWPLLCEHLKA